MTANAARSAATRVHPPREASRARVVLLVDHPQRDLPGVTLVAKSLCEQGCESVLLPANLIQREIWSLAPDFVLLNYLRRPKHLVRLYRALANAGVGLGVLDTEGGVMESCDAFVRDLPSDQRIRESVACYCTWGPKLAGHLREAGVFRPEQLVVTGCPRTDFYAEPWRQSIAHRDVPKLATADSLILLNTNFSLVNPAMISREDQLNFMVESLGHPRERIEQWQSDEEAGLLGLSQLAGELAEQFPSATVVLRPHPFERIETYHELLPDRDNLHCLREGAIEPWLKGASVVIQRSCSTSIESAMIGAPAASPNWLPTAFERPAANATSVPCATPDEMFAVVDDILAGRYTIPIEVARQSEAVIRDWYRGVDGGAHTRVAEAVLASLHEPGSERRRRACRQAAFTGGRRFPHKDWWKGMRRRLAGAEPVPFGDIGESGESPPAAVRQWDESVKRFDAADVTHFLQSVGVAADALQAAPPEPTGLPHSRCVVVRAAG